MIPAAPPMRASPGARPQGHATQVAFRHHLPIPLGYGIQMVLGYRIPVVVVFMKNARVFQKPVPLGYGIPMVLGYGIPVVLVFGIPLVLGCGIPTVLGFGIPMVLGDDPHRNAVRAYGSFGWLLAQKSFSDSGVGGQRR